MDLPPADRAGRRRRVLEALGPHGAMLLAARAENVLGRDTELPYRPDPNLFYLTGASAPQTVALLAPGAEPGPFVLFLAPRDPDRERWNGPRPDPIEEGARLGADAAFPIEELEQRLPSLVRQAELLHFPLLDAPRPLRRMLFALLAGARRNRQRRGGGPVGVVDPGVVLDPMRLRKDEAELARMRAAARATIAGFDAALPLAVDGAGEWEVQAELEAVFRRQTGNDPAFPSIVAAGANATVLHYTRNARRMRRGETLLVDAGATVDGYHGDVSRTVVVGGEAGGPAQELIAAVDEARRAGIAAIRPGASEADVHRAALRVLLDAMNRFGLIDEQPDAVLAAEEERRRARPSEAQQAGTAERPACTRFFPHRVCHWLGLEVHDVGAYQEGSEPARLEPGMVLTVEPGLYVPVDDRTAPAPLRGIGVRLEDDVLVTADGAEVLTA